MLVGVDVANPTRDLNRGQPRLRLQRRLQGAPHLRGGAQLADDVGNDVAHRGIGRKRAAAARDDRCRFDVDRHHNFGNFIGELPPPPLPPHIRPSVPLAGR